MSSIDNAFDLQPQNNTILYRLGTVTSLSSGSPIVRFDGETSPSQKIYKRLASYTSPAINDRVLLLRTSGTYIIQGKIV